MVKVAEEKGLRFIPAPLESTTRKALLKESLKRERKGHYNSKAHSDRPCDSAYPMRNPGSFQMRPINLSPAGYSKASSYRVGRPRPGSMSPERLSILYVSHMPASPPRFGAQARVHGLMTQLARRHDLTAVMLVDDEFDAEECRRAMQTYCRDVVLVPNPYGRDGLTKRALQLRSLALTQSFERLRVTVPALQRALDQILRARRFDVVNLEFSFLGHCDLRQAPPCERLPFLIVDSHNIDYELARQYAHANDSLLRRLYAAANWPKLRREELGTYRDADGVYLCSAADERRLLDKVPGGRTAVIPNAADVEYYQPRPTDPPLDTRTVVFFGLLSYFPNVDGVIHFVQDIWPRIVEVHPDARLKIVGGRAPSSVLGLASARVELTGFVPDLRPHLAAAATVVVHGSRS
jgi:polysaccharide biosynthesis protein PslH